MSANADEFARELAIFADNLEDEVVLPFVQKISMEMLSRIIMRTPVDTGRARANWSVSVGNPVTVQTEAVDPSGGQTIARGAAIIASMDKLETVWISNNLPYANRLENGWSQQAPAGMVAVTFAEIGAFLKG